MSQPRLILALDCSKAGTGWAVGDAEMAPHTGVVSFARHDLRGDVFAAFESWLVDMILMNRPTLVAVEAPFAQAKSADNARLLMGLATVAELVSAKRGIRCVDGKVDVWRKAFLGHARPKDKKEAALRMCRLLGWQTGGDHNRAEAAGLWAWAHLEFGNRQAIRRALSGGAIRNFAGAAE